MTSLGTHAARTLMIPADLNGDDSVGSADLLLFLAEYGAECP